MRVLSIITTFLLGQLALAQPGTNYKKLIQEKDIIGHDVFFAQLQEFQKNNAQYGNVYYQLGKMELEFFSNLDPIVERVASRQYIYNSKTNFGLAKNYADEREIVKNPEWYDTQDLKNKDSLVSNTLNALDEKYQATVGYTEAYEQLIINYDKAVSHYLKAREDFISINTSADNLRDLFLKADDSLRQVVKQVGVHFDSCMLHLDIYRDTYQLLPHPKKRQVNVSLSQIDHFRMNGITPTNFLADDIDMWDYKKWSDTFMELIHEEVDGLKEEITTAYTFFTDTNRRMISGDECIQANIDDLKLQRIINLITKYDNQSVLTDIFSYLIAKLGYSNQLTYERNCNPLSSLPTDDFISRKARIYQNLYMAFTSADSLDEAISSSGHNEMSFGWFFEELMTEGSKAFAESQEKENKETLREEISRLQTLSDEQIFQVVGMDVCYIEQEDLLVDDPTIISDSKICVARALHLTDSLSLLIGSQNDKKILIGAARNEEDYEKKWTHEPYKNGPIDFFKVVSDSSFVIGGIQRTAWLRHISTSGAVKSTIVLKSADSVVDVSYNELQGLFTITQEGAAGLSYSTVDFGGKVRSTKRMKLPGKFLKMWQQERALWFFSSNPDEEQSMITASVFDLESEAMNDTLTYQFSSNLLDPLIVKNDNESITVISKNYDNEAELIYALLDYQGIIKNEEIF